VEIVGAALGRTGTLSLKSALDKLGYKTYHMAEVISNPSTDIPLWLGIHRGTLSAKEVDDALIAKGYNAGVDFPGAPYWKEFFALHPNAKVILTVRDPEKWYESNLESIYQLVDKRPPRFIRWVASSPLWALGDMVQETIWDGFYEGKFKDKEYAINKFNNYINEVKSTVPKEQLLIFDIKDGWGPLCKFLDKPVPQGPFPFVNDRGSFNANIAKHKKDALKEAARFATLTAVTICGLLYIGINLLPKLKYSNT